MNLTRMIEGRKGDIKATEFRFRVLSIDHEYENQDFYLKLMDGGKEFKTEVVDLRKNFIDFSIPFKSKLSHIDFEIWCNSKPRRKRKGDEMDENVEDEGSKVESQQVNPIHYNIRLDLSIYNVFNFKYRKTVPLETSKTENEFVSNLHLRIVLKKGEEEGELTRPNNFTTAEEHFPFYQLFHPEFSGYFHLVRRILSFLTSESLFNTISVCSKHLRRLIQNEFILDFDLSYYQNNVDLRTLFTSLRTFKVDEVVVRNIVIDAETSKFSTAEKIISKFSSNFTSFLMDFRSKTEEEYEDEESDSEEAEESKKLDSQFIMTLKRFALLDPKLQFKKEFVHEVLSTFPNLEYFEVDGEYLGNIRLKSNPRFEEVQRRFPQLAFLVQNTLEVEHVDSDSDSDGDEEEGEEEAGPVDLQQLEGNGVAGFGVTIRINEGGEEREIVFPNRNQTTNNNTNNEEEDTELQQQQQQPTKKRRRRKRKRIKKVYAEHFKLDSFVIHPKKGTLETPGDERNIVDLLTQLCKRCPSLDYIELPTMMGVKILMSPSELRNILMEKRRGNVTKKEETTGLKKDEQQQQHSNTPISTPLPSTISNNPLLIPKTPTTPIFQEVKKELIAVEEPKTKNGKPESLSISRSVRLVYDLDFYRKEEGFTNAVETTYRKVFFLDGYLWMVGLMVKLKKIPEGDLMTCGLLSFDSVYAIQASNEIRIDDTLRTDRKRWYSPQARQMYTVHLTDRRNRRFIEVGLKIQVEQMMKSIDYRDVCFASAKRAEQKRADIQGREDHSLIRIQKNEEHREGLLILFGLEWTYKFYRSKGSVNRASFYVIRNFGGKIVIPMSYRLSLPDVDCTPRFEISACETNYQIHKGWGFTDVIIPESPEDEEVYRLDMRIGEHVMTHEEYTMSMKEMLRGIKAGDRETITVIIPVDNFYASTQYPTPVKICGFPLCLEFYPLGYYGQTSSIAIGLCHHVECYKLFAKYEVEVGGVKQVKEDDQVETIFNQLCPIDKSKREWEFTITIEVIKLEEIPIDLPF